MDEVEKLIKILRRDMRDLRKMIDRIKRNAKKSDCRKEVIGSGVDAESSPLGDTGGILQSLDRRTGPDPQVPGTLEGTDPLHHNRR